ncbi:MAG TPA: DUF805 domain-containing protein [Sulfurovum sp.]|uniref:DUF805 domain-containing protein n=1 Tax=Sulfurovum sp. TaxID=1969726 RepID=UPI002F93AC77
MNWYLKAFKEYATFSGRAQRAEYWYFVLFYIIGFMLMSFLDGMLGSFSMEAGIGLLGGIFLLVHMLPSIAVSVRRLHDIGRTGWWYLLIIIPLIGPLVLFIFSVLDSKEDNQYGPNPKLAAAVA